MTAQIFILLLLGAVLLTYAGIAIAAWLRMRGTRVIVCPENRKPAAVKVDAGHAAVGAMWDRSDVRLADCSRWPERKDCNQACVAQIEIAPEETLATNLLKQWFEGKSCAICRNAIPPIGHTEPKPGLLNITSPGHETLSWDEIPAEHLPVVFETHLPVCAKCHLAESFRRQFPERVVDRAPTTYRDRAVH